MLPGRTRHAWYYGVIGRISAIVTNYGLARERITLYHHYFLLVLRLGSCDVTQFIAKDDGTYFMATY